MIGCGCLPLGLGRYEILRYSPLKLCRRNRNRALLDRCETKRQTLLATLVLFEAESVRNGNLLSAVRVGFRKLSEQLLGLPHFTFVPQVFLCDARIAHKIVKAECDAIRVEQLQKMPLELDCTLPRPMRLPILGRP